jgi:hypothetical protein
MCQCYEQQRTVRIFSLHCLYFMKAWNLTMHLKSSPYLSETIAAVVTPMSVKEFVNIWTFKRRQKGHAKVTPL